MDLNRLYSILQRVEKPSQYLGNEVNVVKKDFDQAEVRVCLVFPDKYEIGMSHIGLKILYEVLNRLPHVVAERCFAPGPDLEAELRKEELSLFSLESKRPLADFDVIGFSLTYELTYTNVLAILDLAGIPLWQKDRTDNDPIILAGGGCTMNAEPMADFLDAAALGDGEDLILDVVECVRKCRGVMHYAPTRKQLLNNLAEIEGIYVPSFFEPQYNADGTIKQVKPLKEGYARVNKRVIREIDTSPYPTKLLVPSTRLVHDRIGIEIQRGCNRACRFCQAGYIDRPVRQRSPETVLKIAEESYRQTGIDSISLLSLSAADYACLVPLLKELNGRYAERKVSLSVPATRTEKMTPELVEQIKQVRKTGFTIAPEAGSERMRRVINKGNKVDDMLTAVRNAFSQGWQLLKLYYMVGLPFETDKDVIGIAGESMLGFDVARSYTRRAELNVSVSSFVPKPHTPFQWEPQMTLEETRRKHDLVRAHLNNRQVRFKYHNPEMSYLEGIFSRGDRRVAQLIEFAYREGCRFDEWEEHFDFSKWQTAVAKWVEQINQRATASGEGEAPTALPAEGATRAPLIDPAFYLHRRRLQDEVLPWDHLFAQMDKAFLWEEYEKARHEAFTEDCSTHRCSDCGVCDFRVVKNRVYVEGDQPVMVKKGNREWYGWRGPKTRDQGLGTRDQKTEANQRSLVTGHWSLVSLKIRFRYSKTGDARFLGHLELMGVIKRAVIRAGLKGAYSEGFHPQMKLSMGHPLPLGVESEWEYFDLELMESDDPVIIVQNLNASLPEGVRVLFAETIDRKVPSIYSALKGVDYEASFEAPLDDEKFIRARNHLSKFLGEKEFFWYRETDRGLKKLNLTDLVEKGRCDSPEMVSFKTRIQPEGSVKPQEVLIALFGLSQEELSRVHLKKVGVTWHP
ncbi:MAG: TIGR03960 family B12-binding radical SAM protein [Deltaproteobacteria bacterium]|nr:TIGR03960 family B12-binding radical SAM protein [Deltaproteobacteria bacterium]